VLSAYAVNGQKPYGRLSHNFFAGYKNRKGVLNMKKNKLFIAGMLALTFGLVLAGCPNLSGSDEDGGGGGGFDSALVTKWYTTQGAADAGGNNFMFELTSDGKPTGSSFTGGVWKFTTSNERISATCTVNGTTVDYGSAAYSVSGTVLTFSNFNGSPNIFQTLSAAGSYYKKVGTGGNGNGNGGSSNPFVGTWTGTGAASGLTLTVTDSTWEKGGDVKGTYTRSGSTATCTTTHY
jgi:hypothetical protein